MTRFGALDCFQWRSMENLPDPHDEVFIRYAGGVLKGQWQCGVVFTEVNGLLTRRTVGAMAWAPILDDRTVTAGDIARR